MNKWITGDFYGGENTLYNTITMNGLPMRASAGDAGRGLVHRLRRSLGVGNGNSLQYSCLENFMDRRAWQGYSA